MPARSKAWATRHFVDFMLGVGVVKSYNSCASVKTMSNDVWYGIIGGAIVSVPIGILSGLAVGPVQKWLDNRSAASRQTKRERQASEYAEVLFFVLRPELLSAYLLVRVTAIVGFFGTIAIAVFAESALPPEFTRQTVLTIHSEGWKVGYIAISMVGFVMLWSVLTRMVENSSRLYRRVSGFSHYAEGLPPDVRNLELEASIKARGDL